MRSRQIRKVEIWRLVLVVAFAFISWVVSADDKDTVLNGNHIVRAEFGEHKTNFMPRHGVIPPIFALWLVRR